MSYSNLLLRETPVAIVGMASIFPGAENLEKYWENILQGINSIREIPENRWKIDDYYDSDPSAPEKTYCKVGGFIPDIDFNPMEFGLPPNLLESTDSSQLFSLVVARDALMDAGYAPGSPKLDAKLRERTGVILGISGGQDLIHPLSSRLEYPVWRKAMQSIGMPEEQIQQLIEKIKAAYVPWTEDSFPGLLGNVIAGRIANRFDLGGINSTVDAACAASLSALKMAISELIEGRCDMMLAGGIDTNNSAFTYMNFSKTPALSKKGHIRPFDQDSDGTLLGEGLGIIVCKRLEDALRDGDRIYATIRGIGSSSDGRFKSIYAPRPQGQAIAIRRAYEEAGYDSSTVSLIEAHGTGTVAGDLSEITSTKMVFGSSNLTRQHIAVGSVKSQIGHTKSAAGIASVIKTALALYHKILPATINVTQPNPQLGLENSPLYINTQTRPWFRKAAQLPRRAGVSAFGFGGVNLHATLEEVSEESQGDYRQYTLHHLILLHEASTSVLLDTCRKQLTLLKTDEAEYQLYQLAKRSKKGTIPSNHPRLGFVASSSEEACQKLTQAIQFLENHAGQEEWHQPLAGIWYRQSALNETHKIVALFTGQGSQYVNMGVDLACAYPTIRSAFNKANRFFEAKGQKLLTDVVFPNPTPSEEERQAQEAKLRQTGFAQPAIGALSAGMYQLMADAGFKANFFVGHSYGELTALWAAGVLTDDAFYGLSKIRGEAMTAASSDALGSMLAMKGNRAIIDQLLAGRLDVWASNLNSQTQLVIGGKMEALLDLQEEAKTKGLSAVMLPVSAAFHTPLISQAQQPFDEAVRRVDFTVSSAPVFSNMTGQAYPTDAQQMKATLAGQIVNPVRFYEQIETIYEQGGRVFVEFGPKNTLTHLVTEILANKPHKVVSLNPNPKKDSDKQLREGVVQLTVLGMNLEGFDPFEKPLAEPTPKTKLTLKLSAKNYVSEATQKRYEEILSQPAITPNSLSYFNEDDDNMNAILAQMQADIAALIEQQNRIQALLTTLIQTSSTSPTNGTTVQLVTAPAPETQPIALNAPLPINGTHESKNGSPSEVTTIPQHEYTANGKGNDVADRKLIEASLLSVVAEKTGYPAEMLELTMDMEADLGIDSIKRVEIFGTMTEAHPAVQGVKQQDLAELRTLQQIVDYLVSKMDGSAASSEPIINGHPTVAPLTNGHYQAQTPSSNGREPSQVPITDEPVVASASTGNEKNQLIDYKIISTSLLSVVAEKTGYPAEMLELTMDMEADLGIDSIKRVEIFGTMTEAHPAVQGVKQQDLAELRTLQQIVDYLVSKMKTEPEVSVGKK